MPLRLVRSTPTPAPQTAAPDPVALYLARLSPGASRDGCRYVLQEIAPLLGGRTPTDVDWPRIAYPDAMRMLASLERRGLSIASRKKARTCLRGVLRECWRLGWMSADELARATDTPAPRGDVLPRGRALTEPECAALWRVALADTSLTGRRNAAILALLYATGMRRNELARLRLEDYDHETGAVCIRSGKGNRQREALVGAADVRAVVNAWLTLRGQHDGYLVAAVINGRLRIRRTPLAGERIWRIVGQLCRRARIPPCSPHDLRRTVGTRLADHAPLDVVQRYLGHQQITTTARYVRRFGATLRQAAEMFTIPW